MCSFSDLVIMEDPLSESFVKHLSVPLLEPLGFGDLLVIRVAVKNVVISFTGWAGPDVTHHIPEGNKSVQPLAGMILRAFAEIECNTALCKVTLNLPQFLHILQVAD